MKSWLPAFAIIIFFLTLTSCEKSVKNSGIVGGWVLVEQYDGYANGGNYQWNHTPAESSHVLTFTQGGNYLKTEKINGSPFECAGTYLLRSDNKLEINSSCNTVTEIASVSELTPKTLILDRSGREGVIRYKYSATK